MPVIGFHNSHEQVHPAAAAGRGPARRGGRASPRRCAPTTSRPGASGRGTPASPGRWLGAAMATTCLPFGVVNAPGQRYHPAIVAQAIAHPRRDVPRPVLGRARHRRGDERAHHRATAGRARSVRDARLRECVDVIRALLAGEEVTHDGLVTVDRARIWTLPEQPPALIGAGGQRRRPPRAARRLGRRAGHRSTSRTTRLREMIAAYRDAGGRGHAGAAGAPLLGPRPGPRPLAHRARPVAQQRLPAAAVLGPRHRRGLRRWPARTSARRTVARGGAHRQRPRPARRLDRRVRSSSASTRSTCTTSAQEQRALPRRLRRARAAAARRHRARQRRAVAA